MEQLKQASEADTALQSQIGSRRDDEAAPKGRCDLNSTSVRAASQTRVTDLKKDCTTLRSCRDPPQTSFDADAVLNGIAGHVQAMTDRIGELGAELAKSSARNVDLAETEENLAASPKVIKTTTSGRSRVGEQSVTIEELHGELQATITRETERLAGQMQLKEDSEANMALQSQMGSRRNDETAPKGRCDLHSTSACVASLPPVADLLKRDFATLRGCRDPHQMTSVAGTKRLKGQIHESCTLVKQSTTSDEVRISASSIEETSRCTAQRNVIERLEETVKRKDKELGELRKETSDLSENVRGMKTRMTESEGRLKLFLRESEGLRSSLEDETRRYAELKQVMAESAEETRNNIASLASARSTIQSQVNEIDELKGEVKRKDEELGKLKSEISYLSKEVRGMETRMTESESCTRLALQESEKLRSSLDDETRRYAKLEQVMVESAEKIRINENRLASAESTNLELRGEVKRKDEEIGELSNRILCLSNDVRDIDDEKTEFAVQMSLKHQESERLQSSLVEKTRRCAQLNEAMKELAEDNDSNKVRLAKFEEDAAKTKSFNAQMKMIASRCLCQLQMASNEVGSLSRSLKGEAEPDTRHQRTKLDETVLAIQATLNKFEDSSNAENLTPENHCCPVCYDSYGSKVVPTLLQCCLNHVCVGCLEKDRAQKTSLLVGNKKQIQCMFCNHSFHCAKDIPWRVNRPYIDAIGIRVDSNDLHQESSSQGTKSSQDRSSEARRGSGRALQLYDWLIFESSDDRHQQFWLGRAVGKSDWGGSCKRRNETNAAVSIEGALINPGCYAINVQWYNQRAAGLLEYVREGQPLVQSNAGLRLRGFNGHVHHRRDAEGSYFELDISIKVRAESLIARRHL